MSENSEIWARATEIMEWTGNVDYCPVYGPEIKIAEPPKLQVSDQLDLELKKLVDQIEARR